MRCGYVVIIFSLIFFLLCVIKTLSEEAVTEFIPLTKGNFWIYSGTIKWQNDDGDVSEEELTWKMEITETVEKEGITGAVLKGHPSDLEWYYDGKERGNYLIVKTEDGKYYSLENNIAETFEKIEEGRDISDLLDVYNLFLDLPLTGGKTFGDPAGIKREDNWYCWYVEVIEEVELNIKACPSSEKEKKYRLAFRSCPAHIIIEYVPGVGIIYYEYVHHGTVSEVRLNLIEYGRENNND
ncbi:hypothetical protein C4588_02655 [Candidatus Parcubacteria bacterium]|nr:MAG: hypothetical protein C4588_02655 [Candidatus Parcubacteria bacterium]